jgi:enediyne core biosynthesis thioesterase
MHGTSPPADQGAPMLGGGLVRDFEAEPGTRMLRAYRYRHCVSFEDTNLFGNVYFARYISWQGRCRELFLLEHATGVLAEFERSLRLVTINVACEYFVELRALDEIEISMSLAYRRQHRIGLAFDYRLLHRAADAPAAGHVSAGTLVARGTQEVGCMQRAANGLVPCAVPVELAAALDTFH